MYHGRLGTTAARPWRKGRFGTVSEKPGAVRTLYVRQAKRALDIGISTLALCVLTPPIALVCVAILIDSPGPPLFRQERVGRHGISFDMWKLRTMRADAEAARAVDLSPEQQLMWERDHKLRDDPRVTRVGRFLRRTSIDEVPQFINVLLGDMSIVGPRPVTRMELDNFHPDERAEVLAVRPGITGWWQTCKYGDKAAGAAGAEPATWSNGRRQAMELFYVRHASLALDMHILLRTVSVVLGARNS